MRKIRKAVRETIRLAETRLTLLDIERRLSRYGLSDRKAIRSAVRTLVDRQELMFVSDFGRTFIEASLHKPIRITSSIILKPLNCNVKQSPGDIVVSLCHGTSFGSGQHPTTRLCLKGLDSFVGNGLTSILGEKATVLDIGTGSGVLIITALKMGFVSGVGIDIDACAISEAQSNVHINGLSNKITISAQPFEEIAGTYSLIIANLRLPTLKSFLPIMVDRVKAGGMILLSGVKCQESGTILNHGLGLGLHQAWTADEKGWAAIGFQKD